MFRTFVTSVALSLAALLTGCAATSLPTNSVGSIHQGVVVQVNEVKLTPSNSTQWTISSVTATLVGVAANTLADGKSYAARSAITAIGAAIGGIGGKVAVDSVGAKGYEYIVSLPGRDSVSVTQPQADGLFQVGTPVLLINQGGIYRVTINTAPAAAAPVEALVTNAQSRQQVTSASKAAAARSIPERFYTKDGRPVEIINGKAYIGAQR